MGKLWLLVAAIEVATTLAPDAHADPPVRGGQRSQPIYAIGPVEAYHVETEHGTIYGEVARPVDPTTGTPVDNVPVLLTISPYNAEREPNLTDAHWIDGNQPFTEHFVPRGYARAVFDMLGTHNSTGCWDFGGTRDREVAAALVEFLGTQSWTNGNVAVVGMSWEGTTPLMAAVERPPHLAAIIAQAGMSRLYEHIFWQGVPFAKGPVYQTPGEYDFIFGGPPSSVDRSDLAHNVPVIQSRAEPCDRIEHTQRAPQDDPVFDDFWIQRDYRGAADRIDVPVLIEAGWADLTVFPLQSMRLFNALHPALPKRLAIGPWGHGAAAFDDSMDLRHAWLDEFLLGLDTGVLDGPRILTQPVNAADRRAEETWPPRGTKVIDIELVDGSPGIGQAGILEGDSIYTDANPAHSGYEPGVPIDPTSTWVAYETAPLTQDVRISGAPRLLLRATSTNDSTHYCVSVVSRPTIQQITIGALNTRNLRGLHVSEPVPSGTTYTAALDLFDNDIVVPKGQTIMVSIASTNQFCRQDDQPGSTNDILPGTVLQLPVSEGAAALAADAG